MANRVPPERRRGLKKFGLRKCLQCKEILNLDSSNFWANKTAKGAGGFDWYCKKCKSSRNKKYYKNPKLKHRFELLKKYKFTCQYCGAKAPNVLLHIDHIKPLSKGGSSDDSNLTVACAECNIGKRDNEL